ncbi:MAG TPA: hypothetical protein VJK09_03400 [Candidatus Paceibacterota bacterium]
MWSIALTPIALERLGEFEHVIQKRIWKKLDWFTGNFTFLSHEPLHIPFDGFYKLRIGDVRAVYSIDFERKQVIIQSIKWRDKAYKRG